MPPSVSVCPLVEREGQRSRALLIGIAVRLAQSISCTWRPPCLQWLGLHLQNGGDLLDWRYLIVGSSGRMKGAAAEVPAAICSDVRWNMDECSYVYEYELQNA